MKHINSKFLLKQTVIVLKMFCMTRGLRGIAENDGLKHFSIRFLITGKS